MPEEYRDTSGDSSELLDGTVIDPGEVGNVSGDEPPRTRRKRKDAGQARGSRTPGEKKASLSHNIDLSSLTGMFVGIHALLAGLTDTPELELSEDEGKMFMKSAQNVLRHYSVQTTQKSMDIIALIGVTATIYAPRIAGIGFRKRMAKKPSQDDNNVVHFPNGVSGGIYNGDLT